MKKSLACWIFCLCCCTVLSAQFRYPKAKKDVVRQVSLGAGLVATPVLGNTFWGFGMDIKYLPQPKWGTGLNMVFSQRKMPDDYGYTVGQPIIEYLEVGWINHYDLFQSQKVRVNFNLNNGLIFSELADNSIKIRYRTRYGYSQKPKPVVTSVYYLVEPGLEISTRLTSSPYVPNIYLTAQAKYRLAVGGGKFGSDYSYTGYLFSLGITMIGVVSESKR
jgi:predicted small secreted protein